MQKQALFKIKGMLRDISSSSFTPEFAYENKNIRLTTIGKDNTVGSIINEKGNKYMENGVPILGTPIGKAEFTDDALLFVCGEENEIEINITGETDIEDVGAEEEVKDFISHYEDYIYRLWFDGNKLNNEVVYEGDLNFQKDKPIESLPILENINKKVYFTDNHNPLRMLNLNNVTKDLDFVLKINKVPTISIQYIEGGRIPAGVMLYVITGYNLYGPESNILFCSKLYYASLAEGGLAPNAISSTGTKITLTGSIDFQYIKVYRIHRSSLEGTPAVDLIADVPSTGIDGTGIVVEDDGSTLGSVDPTELLFVGGKSITAKTITAKEDTLFIGNIKKKIETNTEVKEILKEGALTCNIETTSLEVEGFYDYKINTESCRKLFKLGETYRLGIIPVYKGEKNNIIWLNDLEVKAEQGKYGPPTEMGPYDANLNTNNFYTEFLYELGYNKVNLLIAQGVSSLIPVVVYPGIQDRTILVLGIVSPTVSNAKELYDGTCRARSSWFFRPSGGKSHRIAFRHGWGLNGKARDSYGKPEFLPEIRSSTHTGILSYNKLKVKDTNSYLTAEEYIDRFGDLFFVDSHYITFHAPEIEYSHELDNINFNDYKFRIVAYACSSSEVKEITKYTFTKSNGVADTLGDGKHSLKIEYKNEYNIVSPGVIDIPWKVWNNKSLWINNNWSWDYYPLGDEENWAKQYYSFAIHPWQSTGTMTDSAEDGSVYNSIQNNKFSRISIYDRTYWIAEEDEYSNVTYINKPYEVESYYCHNNSIRFKNGELYSGRTDLIINQNSFEDASVKIFSDTEGREVYTYSNGGYPMVITPLGTSIKYDDINSTGKYLYYTNLVGDNINIKVYLFSHQPTWVCYHCTPHIIILLAENNILPYFASSEISEDDIPITEIYPFFDRNKKYTWKADTINYPKSTSVFARPYIFVGEFYKDSILDRFGGTSEVALANNKWVKCGEEVTLEYGKSCTVKYTEGDTYFQRYDCLKTYPYDGQPSNNVVDITGVLLESRINSDLRYDVKNRYAEYNLYANPSNFNLINPVYNQTDNFFTYNYVIDEAEEYPTTITWTKTKQVDSRTDVWTNITLASSLFLNGEKGEINSLNLWNNNLIAFQDKAISQILYNENVQISSTAGVPIEIANSGKVLGSRLLYDYAGCLNKWSIVKGEKGLYFTDDYSKDIYVLGGNGLISLSKTLGFSTWASDLETVEWNPSDFKGLVAYKDNHGDILFITKDECLAFSEDVNQFTSFYSYENTPYFINIKDKTLSVNDNNIWLLNEGDYNMYFGKYQPFYTTIVANPDFTKDKIFNNIEFRADSWDKEEILTNNTFDTLDVWNEYQQGTESLVNILGKPSPLKKKFRIWRANIPRDNSNHRDRMRNPWLYLKLSKENINKDKTILHDITVHYFD